MSETWWRRYWAGNRGSDWPQTAGGFDTPEAIQLYRAQAMVIRWLYGDHRPARVLELGCGNGALYEVLGLKDSYYLGVDFRKHALDDFRVLHPGARLLEADAATFRAAETFDLIFSVSLIHYFDVAMLRAHLANARAMLSPEGVVILADFRWRSRSVEELGNTLATFAGSRSADALRENARGLNQFMHSHSYSRRRILTLAADAGFSCEFFGSLVWPGYLTARLKPLPRR